MTETVYVYDLPQSLGYKRFSMLNGNVYPDVRQQLSDLYGNLSKRGSVVSNTSLGALSKVVFALEGEKITKMSLIKMFKFDVAEHFFEVPEPKNGEAGESFEEMELACEIAEARGTLPGSCLTLARELREIYLKR